MKEEMDYLDHQEVIKISDECCIQGFYFSGKFMKKRILLVEQSKFNSSYMEDIKSRQLKRKTEFYLNKWIQKAIKKLNTNYALISKNSSDEVLSIIENCFTQIDKDVMKEAKRAFKTQKHSEWTDYYELIKDENNNKDKKKESENSKKTKNHVTVNKTEIRKAIKSCFSQSGVVEIGEIFTQNIEKDDYKEFNQTNNNDKKNNTNEEYLSNILSDLEDDNIKCLSCGCNPFVKPEIQKYSDNSKTFLQYGRVKSNVETQTDPAIIEISMLKEEHKHIFTEDAETQTATEVKIVQKISKILSEIDPYEDLGCPSDKRTNELETIYDEINSTIRKAKKSKSNLLIKTPDVHYIAFDSFKLLTDEEQQDLLSHYKGHATLVKQIVKLRNIGLSAQTENKFVEAMNKDQMLIGSLNILIHSIKERIKSLPPEDLPEIQTIMFEEPETTMENTPLEGNSSSLSLNDNLIEDLMSSLDFS